MVLREDPRVRHEVVKGEWGAVGVPGAVAEQAWEWTDVVRTGLTVSGWGSGQEADEIVLPRPLDGSLSTQVPSQAYDVLGDDRFMAVPGAVALVERVRGDGAGVTVLGFQ